MHLEGPICCSILKPVVILGPVLLEASSLLEVGGQLLRLLRLDVELATSRAVRWIGWNWGGFRV